MAPSHHTGIFCTAIAVLLGMAGELRAQQVPPATRPAATTVELTPTSLPGAETFIYRDSKPEPMRLFAFKPENWKASDRRPAMVFFFGGGFVRGTPDRAASWARFAARHGMVGVAPDYRTISRHGTTAAECIADGRASVRWLQDHAAELGIDQAKIVVGGNSAGGTVAVWTAIEKSPPGSDPNEAPRTKPAALLLVSAPTDTLNSSRASRFGPHAEALSALQQLDAKMPPILAFHGDADTTVAYSDTVKLHEKLTAAGNRCQFVTVPGGTHSFTSAMPEWRQKLQETWVEFLTDLRILPVPPAK